MIFESRKSIFPVILIDFENDHEFEVNKIRGGKFLGTGFFLNNGKSNIFVTARHVVDIKLKKNQKIGIGDLDENGKYWWDYFEFHKTSDIAISLIEFGLPSFVTPLNTINPKESLYMGTNICTFGFPLSESHTEEGKSVLKINEVFFSGYISSVLAQADLEDIPRAFTTNYALSFDCPNGLSGAPLLIKTDKMVYVAGLIYGTKKIQYLLDEIIELEEENEKYKEHNYKVTHWGLSSGLQELIDGNDFIKFAPYD